MTSEVMSLLCGNRYRLRSMPRPSTTPEPKSRFGSLLRGHRLARRRSQEELAADAEISTRHLSCLETGKAQPSRTMVLVLGSALDLPLRDRNALLGAAGFTPAYGAEPLDAPEEEKLRRAVDLVLERMEPFGAVVIDRAGNVVRMNQGAARLLRAFVDMSAAPPEVLANVLVATLHPKGLRPAIVNFDEVGAFVLDRARREALAGKNDPVLAEVSQLLRAIPDLPSAPPLAPGREMGPFLTVHLRRGDVEGRFFTTLATIGTPIDATAEDLQIETYFPSDEATRDLVYRLARAGTERS